MTDKVYLIHEEDYVKHIRDKDRLFWLLKRMIKQVIDLQPTRDNKELFMSAIQIGCDIDREYVSWGIPLGFSCKGTADELRELMENELIAPENAGYYACDDTCCCQCGCCCDNCDLYDDEEDYDGEDYDDEDYDDYDEDEDETDVDDDFAELMAGLSSIAQSIFGDNVSVHIVVE